jgi:type VI secretion system protein ImpH
MNAPQMPDGITPLMQALLARAPQMNFFQLCQLLDRLTPQDMGLGTRDTPVGEAVRFRPYPKVGFPGTELAAVESDPERPDRPPTIRTTFLGLYGVNAVMPPHLIDDIVLRREGHEEVMAFLDLFNHRIATLFYRTWRKYRYPSGFERGDDNTSRALLCLAGFGLGDKAGSAGLPDARVLGLLGLLTQRTRTVEGLAGVVALALPGAAVKVDERFPVWVRLNDQPGLRSGGTVGKLQTAGHGLGQGHVLGRRVMNRGEAVRVTLRPSTPDQAHDLLPGAPLHRELISMLRVYVGNKADVVLRMEVSASVVPILKLGPAHAQTAGGVHQGRLAWTTLLKPANDRVITIPMGRYEAIPTEVVARPAPVGKAA